MLDLPVNRSMVWARPVPSGIEMLCDCATLTALVFEGEFPADFTTHEDFYVCDGCGSVHWFTITRETTSEGAP